MRDSQRGIAHLGLLILVLIIAAISFVGWYVWQSKNSTGRTNNSIESAPVLKTYTDSTKSFSIQYPDNWILKEQIWQDCCEGSPKPEPDWSKETKPIDLKPSGAHPDINITVTANPNPPVSTDEYVKSGNKDRFNSYTKLKINGYDAVYHKLDFVGPAEVEAYLDHRYFVTNNKSPVEFYFRERYRHNWNNEESGGKVNFDGSKYYNDFVQIVKSIQFLK